MKQKQGLLFLLITAMILLGSSAFAMPIKWDVSAAGSPGSNWDVDTLTGLFDQIGFDAQTTTIQYDTDGTPGLSVGDKFSDTGNLDVNGLIAPSAIDEEGLAQLGNYEVTSDWSNIQGEVTGVALDTTTNDTRIDVKYTSGTMNFFLDTTMDAVFANPAGSTPPAGAGGTGFNDGVLIGSLDLLGGIGHTYVDFTGSPVDNQGSVDLALQFTFMQPGFWLNSLNVDLLTLNPTNFHFALTDMNIDTPTQVMGVQNNTLYIAHSNENGSVTIDVVPEPGTVLLFGMGLIGLCITGYRRKKS